ncbi:thiolase family protein [Staphylococcus coagulans]|uniref:thiolase family protein n=1 Tax=Staphylococcus coagulans TaxID=74706 RepID=UPI001BE61E78|nr:thiolase family protein [Staphylococcus coagulans]MBT2831285.1 thiolase family protein [Staphylococcus coagulans]MBT2860751.1 thiolase family protein [Staphylococcus coagulans]MBU3872607.1 thiolase family protein [Staphylococcus coagulans]
MTKAVIVAAKRTPIGVYGGLLKRWEPEALLKPLFEYFVENLPCPLDELDDVIIGNIVGKGGNIARKSLLEAGIDVSIPGLTVDRQCGSGLEAIHLACRLIESGAGDFYIAGGVESVSRAPWKMEKPTSLYPSSPPTFYERAPFAPEGQDPSMIEAADNVAKQYHVTREDQDRFAVQSHHRTSQAIAKGVIEPEILPLSVNGQQMLHDESVKPKIQYERIARLKPLREGGTVTVGNCCLKHDGACLVVVMSEQKAGQLGLTQGLAFVDYAMVGVDPNLLGIGPVPAVKRILEQQQLTIEQIDAVELNEAFSSQVLASQRELDIRNDQLNRFGGAIAMGHPYSASGAILVTRLFYMMDAHRTIATMGIGGGMGNAALFERWA